MSHCTCTHALPRVCGHLSERTCQLRTPQAPGTDSLEALPKIISLKKKQKEKQKQHAFIVWEKKKKQQKCVNLEVYVPTAPGPSSPGVWGPPSHHWKFCFSVPTGVSLHVTLRAPPLSTACHVDGFSAVKNTFIPVPVLLFKKPFLDLFIGCAG